MFLLFFFADIDLISRFAQLEVKFGQLERGKTLFDTLLMSYPKRTDLWLVYIDTLTKAGDVESARSEFHFFFFFFCFLPHFNVYPVPRS